MGSYIKVCCDEHTGMDAKLRDLPESQARGWRHKCAACAYELGVANIATELQRARAYALHLEQMRQLTLAPAIIIEVLEAFDIVVERPPGEVVSSEPLSRLPRTCETSGGER